MKKNITINLFGTLYAIDEDAYQLLENYLEGMKNYFKRQEGGEEIADDIEHRVAELFWELKQQGTDAINIEHVKAIIQKIGNPQEMDTADNEPKAETGSNAQPQSESAPHEEPEPEFKNAWDAYMHKLSTRKLYRDTSDKLMGGVLSGFCHFFGGNDPLPWRLIFIVLVLLVGTPNWWDQIFPMSLSTLLILGYFICWAVLPPVQTPEDKLRMKGKKVTPENLNEEIIQENESKPQQAYQQQNTANGCLSGFVKFVVFCFKALVFFILAILLFGLGITAIAMFGAFFGMGAEATTSMFGISEAARHFISDYKGLFFTATICGIAALILPLWAIIRSLLSNKKMSAGHIITLILIELLCLAGAIGCTISLGMTYDKVEDDYDKYDTTGDTARIEQPYDIRDFDALDLENAVKVLFTQADTFSVVAEGRAMDINDLDLYKNGSTLYCTCKDNGSINNQGITLHITAPELREILGQGAIKVETTDTIRQENLRIHMEGASKGDITFKGNTCDVEAEGASKLTLNLNCKNLKLRTAGACKTTLNGIAESTDFRNEGVSKIENNLEE